jgi:aminoglycoside phosphotransferase family enzyme
LNRRLCPDDYLGVVPIREERDRIAIGDGPGTVVDYAVWMRRLPEDGMLDRRLSLGSVRADDLVAIADRLASFHAAADSGEAVNRLGGPSVMRRNWEENLRQSAPYVGRTVADQEFRAIGEYGTAWLSAQSTRLERRMTEGRVRDGHGDVRAANICLVHGAPHIFDCVEFDDRLRCGDVVLDVAFLAMDLDARCRGDLRKTFVDAYVAASGDVELPQLLPFFECHRAVVRGKVESLRSAAPEFGAADRAIAASWARRYFGLAAWYAGKL